MYLIQYILIFYFFVDICCSQNRVDGITAIVGKNIILHSDVLQRAQFVALEQQIDPSKSPYLFEEIYFNTRDNMINQYAVLDVAEKDTNLVITNDEVDRALNQQIDEFVLQAGSEKQFLDLAGMSMRQIKADYWKDIRDMMIVEKYQFSKIQNLDVSRKEVHDFYNVYKDSIPSLSEQYNFSIIEIPFIASYKSENETKSFLDSLKNKLQNDGVSFDSLAQKYSQDPGSAPAGGYLGYTSRGSLVREFEEIAYSLSPGEISAPVKTDFGYHLIRLIDKQGEKISVQHILRSVGFSEEDKNSAYLLINNLVSKIKDDPIIFDSLANNYSKKYNNYSGKYLNSSPNNIPDIIFLNLNSLNPLELSSPIETSNGFALIFFYNHQKKREPDLVNSWNLIYNYAKQKKQTVFFQNWINSIKSETYIRIIHE